jgi:4-amino-4-deoxy-L-arabinose transferase-like glycosyltransferase
MPLSEFAVRLPNALVGVLDIVLMFFVARQIFRSDFIGVIAAAMLAFTPAHFIHSRLAVSLLLPLPFALAWLWWLAAFVEKETIGRLWGAAVSLGLGLYGYLASVLLMPIYLACSAWVAANRDIIRRSVVLIAGFLIPAVPLVIWELAHPERFGQMISIYHPYAPRFGPLQGLKEMLSYFSLGVRSANYWTNLNPSLLFFEGDASLINSTRLAGVFLWPMAFLMATGTYQMLTSRRSPFALVILIGFITAPLPQVLTVDVGIRRSLVMVVFGVLMAAYGVEFLLMRGRLFRYRVAAILILIVLPFSFRNFYRNYVGDYQTRAAFWFGGNIRGMFEDLIALRPKGSTSPIYLSNKVPYLDEYGAFYSAAHARDDLLPDTHYYTPDEIDVRAQPARSLLVAPVNEKPGAELLTSNGWRAVKTVREPTGQPVFVIFEKK